MFVLKVYVPLSKNSDSSNDGSDQTDLGLSLGSFPYKLCDFDKLSTLLNFISSPVNTLALLIASLSVERNKLRCQYLAEYFNQTESSQLHHIFAHLY